MLPTPAPPAAALPRSRLRSPLVLVGIAAALLLAGSAAMLVVLWPDGVTVVVVPAGVPVSVGNVEARVRRNCDSCGVIESIRRTDPVTGLPIYAFTVRMEDGSARESGQLKPGRWLQGERVILIGGPAARAEEERINEAP